MQKVIFVPPHHDDIGRSCVCPSVVRSSIFSFPGDNLSKYRWILTKLGVCIDIVVIWFGIANEKIRLSV